MQEQLMEEEVLIPQKQQRVEITEQTPYILICCYGTLLKNCGNHNHILAPGLKEGTVEFMGRFTSAPNYTMYGKHSGFPIITEGIATIEYEVYKVSSQKVVNQLHNLEGSSGIPNDPRNWYDIVPIETPVGQAWIYLQHNYKGNPESIITNGDWLKRK